MAKPKPVPTRTAIAEPRLAEGHRLPASAKARSTTAAAVTPAVTAPASASGIQAWMLVLLGVSGLMILLSLIPERAVMYGHLGRRLVKSRVAFAAVGIGIFVGLIVPVLAELTS